MQYLGSRKYNDLQSGKLVKFYFECPFTCEEVSATIKRDDVYGIITYILSGNGSTRRVQDSNILDMFERGEYRIEPNN